MVEIDTSKMEDCGSDIIRLSKDLEIIFNEIFSEMSKLVVNGVWSGNAAIEFASKVSIEKANYIDFQKNLCNYGLVLKNNANAFNKATNEVN